MTRSPPREFEACLKQGDESQTNDGTGAPPMELGKKCLCFYISMTSTPLLKKHFWLSNMPGYSFNSSRNTNGAQFILQKVEEV